MMEGNIQGKRKMPGWSRRKAIRRRLLILDQFAKPGGLGEIFEIAWACLVLFFLITIWKSKPAGRPDQRLLTAPAKPGEAIAYRTFTRSCSGSGGSPMPAHRCRGKSRGLLLWTPPELKKSHRHKGLKIKRGFSKGSFEVASVGYRPTDGCRNTLVKYEVSLQCVKKSKSPCSQF